MFELPTSESKDKNLLFFKTHYNDFQESNFFVYLYNKIPSFFYIEKRIDVDRCFEAILEKYNIDRNSSAIVRNEEFREGYSPAAAPTYNHLHHVSYYIAIKDELFVNISYHALMVWYSNAIPFAEVIEIGELAHIHSITTEGKPIFYMITRSVGDWDLSPFTLKPPVVDLHMHYNDDFIYYHNLIEDSLKQKDKTGVVILHGMHGTGKTTYIRYLISCIGLKFIYVPAFLVNSLADPDFLPFIAEHQGCILIMEDCEQILVEREQGNVSSAITNILNMGDGLLGDALNIKIICTFNTSLSKIDKALTRKGRMIARYEFGELKHKKAEELATMNSLAIDYSKPLTLANIYGATSEIEPLTDKAKIGFK